jgi:hypothetical protein
MLGNSPVRFGKRQLEKYCSISNSLAACFTLLLAAANFSIFLSPNGLVLYDVSLTVVGSGQKRAITGVNHGSGSNTPAPEAACTANTCGLMPVVL